MVTQLKAKDLPQAWNSSKKSCGGTQRQKSNRSKMSPVEDTHVQNLQVEHKKRGRPPGKSASKVVTAPKGMKTTRPLPASAVNVLLSMSQTSVADVEELRRKRQEDAEACGRVVRTVSSLPKRRSTPTTVTENCKEDDGKKDGAVAGNNESLASIPQSSRVVPSIGPSIGENERIMTLLERGENECEPVFSRRPGTEPIAEDADNGTPPPEHKQEYRRRQQEQVDIERDSDSQEQNEGQHGQRQGRGRSPTTKYSRETYEGRQLRFGNAMGKRRQSYQERSDESVSRSPRRKMYRSSPLPESWSPQQSDSRSPLRRARHCRNNNGHKVDYYDEYGFRHRRREDHWNSGSFYSEDRSRRQQYKSLSPESCRRHKSSRSQEHGHAIQQKNRSPYSCMSPPIRSMTPREATAKDWSNCGVVKEEDTVETSAASDKRRRRHENRFVELQKGKRQTEGKTPFYLMLNREGKPYGPGKPSWTAQVNKLAKGLDPSCTHIKKQTYEDVQTFKDRLDDDFEYSGPLNEDYLRALMGKAVTKKRIELITFIKNGGKQPKHIDKEVWHRLEKLATSKQREQKSEQGRHANACRKVIGRTGRRGIDSVQEKLRSLLGRSPDPSEIEEEMQRDKGYGGRKRKNSQRPVMEESNSAEAILVDEEIQSKRSSSESRPLNCNAGNKKALDCHVGPLNEEGRLEYGVEVVDGAASMTEDENEGFTNTETNEMTKDKYIEKLKAEIKLLHKEKGKMLTSNEDATYRKMKN